MTEIRDTETVNCVPPFGDLRQSYGGLWDGRAAQAPFQAPIGKVYAAVHGVMTDLCFEGIPKGQEAQFEYGGKPRRFRGIDDVMQKLSMFLVKHKLLIMPWLESHKVERIEKPNRSGGTTLSHLYSCVWKYRFISVEDGSTYEIRIANETIDTSDKGLGKNMSYAYKYAMLQAFCIPVEGNEEQDAHNPEIMSERVQHERPGMATDTIQHNRTLASDMRERATKSSTPSLRAPRLRGKAYPQDKPPVYADSLDREALINYVRSIMHAKESPQFEKWADGMLAELLPWAKEARGMTEADFSVPKKEREKAAKMDAAAKQAEAEIPDHLYVCVMPGKASYNKDIRQLEVDILTRYLLELEKADTKLSMREERIKLVREEIELRISQGLPTS